MPGTIQVSVLYFKGLSSSNTSSLYLKVSMGEREYQTWDKGDFSFPLANFRDNLIVTLNDAEGNLISQKDVQIRSIIEKGIWDYIFPFEGGGHVHMKLEFILSEEERHRIRSVRESVMKKERIPNVKLRPSETTTHVNYSSASSLGVHQEVPDSQRDLLPIEVTSTGNEATKYGLSSNPESFIKDSLSSGQHTKGTILKEIATVNTAPTKEIATNAADANEETSVRMTKRVERDLVHHWSIARKLESNLTHPDVHTSGAFHKEASRESKSSESGVAATMLVSGDPEDEKIGKQGLVEKTPSNIRKMISAFERNLVQDTRPPIECKATRSPIKKNGREALSKDEQLKIGSKQAEPKSGSHRYPILAKDLQQKQTYVSTKGENESSSTEISSRIDLSMKNVSKAAKNQSHEKELAKLTEGLLRPSTSKTAKVSEGIRVGHSDRSLPSSFSNVGHGYNVTSVLEGKTIIFSSNNSPDLDTELLKDKLTSVIYCEYEHFPYGSTGTWMFPSDTRRLCITTACRKIRNLVGGFHIGGKKHVGERNSVGQILQQHSSQHDTEAEMKNSENKSHNSSESRSEISDDNGSTGPFRQAIKFAIIIGFGVFVLLTRQKEPRKSSSSSKADGLFVTTHQTSTAEMVDLEQRKMEILKF